MDEPDSKTASTARETYEHDRTKRLERGRLIGFSAGVLLWVLSVVPLARASVGDREGIAVVLVYLVVGAITLAIAAVVRAAYSRLRNHRFWSPWLFLMAALLAIVGYAVQSAGDKAVPLSSARVATEVLRPERSLDS